MQPYNEYKCSNVNWIHDIPHHWELKKFKHLFQIKKEIVGELGHAVLSITQKGIKEKNIESGEGQIASDYKKYQKVEPGDFAMNHMDLLTGYVDLSPYKGVTSPDYRVFTLKDKASDKKYYLYILQLCYAYKIFYPLGQGAAHVGRWRLPSDAFKEFMSPRPPINEQQEIVKFLDRETDRLDQLIAEKENFIKLLREKRQALISHAVTKGLDPNVKMRDSGIEWIGEVPKHWAITRIKNIATINASVKKPKLDNSELIGFVPMTNVDDKKGVIEKIDQRMYGEVSKGYTAFQTNDVIFAKITPCMENGNCALVPDVKHGFAFGSTEFVVFRATNALLPRYLHMLLRNMELRKICEQFMTGTAGQQRISTAFLSNFPVALPPVEEQGRIIEEIGQRIRTFESIEDEVENSIQLLKEHRTALISAAVTGKIDVRNAKDATVTDPIPVKKACA